MGGPLEVGGDLVIGKLRGRGPVPCLSVRVVLGVTRGCQCLVGAKALGGAGTLVHGRTNERVAERDVRPDFEEARGLGRCDRVLVEVELPSRPPDRVDITGWLCGHDEEELLGCGWKDADLAEEVGFEFAVDGEWFRELRGAGHLIG